MTSDSRGSRGNLALKLCFGFIALGCLWFGYLWAWGGGYSPWFVILAGFFCGVPALLFAVVALLGHVSKPTLRTADNSHQYWQASDIAGTCPNCDALINIASLECPNCRASFGSRSAWRVRS